MANRFEGKVAVVTGGGQGIGRAIALKFAREGADIVVADISHDKAEKTAREIERTGCRAMSIKADVISARGVDEIVAQTLRTFGRIDIWVNNVGGRRNTQLARLIDMEEEVWDAVIANNLKSTFLCSRAAAREMVKRGQGCIVNISSILGKTGGINASHYSSAKAAIIRFSDVLAKELGPHGIRVNAVCPGYVDTPALRESMASLVEQSGKSFEDIMKDLAASDIPVRRSQEPEDVANVVAFLCSEEADYMTGQAINVSGGLEMH